MDNMDCPAQVKVPKRAGYLFIYHPLQTLNNIKYLLDCPSFLDMDCRPNLNMHGFKTEFKGVNTNTTQKRSSIGYLLNMIDKNTMIEDGSQQTMLEILMNINWKSVDALR